MIVMHVCILFPNLDALQMTGLWTAGSRSPPDCCHIFTLFLKMVESLFFIGNAKGASEGNEGCSTYSGKYEHAGANIYQAKFACLNCIN